ncbi:MAG: hypothetical protein WCQ69_06755 [Bacteroidales bacterium]|jgi:hypothetical protein|nr:hypothetical protein [Bacteroidales bacterium]MDD2263803.1 hypothetical protein [Bacteroidales bacterium]MDD2830979.1 hypothetical protein [Bacteroidales bacterium]MDD3208213.1 hypothetical protein [Bacteroidales bacterium]MDD3696745.1 hypothetical protein [Bacteroidales bacterium]
MNNLVNFKTGDISVTGRSHYWGEIYVSFKDKEIEYATLFEDVITQVGIPEQPGFSIYTVRYISQTGNALHPTWAVISYKQLENRFNAERSFASLP